VRSANRAARVAEQSLLVALRPLLMPSRLEDPPQKVGFMDDKWFHIPGNGAAAEASDDAVYLAIPLRNVGTGIAVLHGWAFFPRRLPSSTRPDHAPLDDFYRLTRDLYISAGDVGFWQGAFRDTRSEAFAVAKRTVEAREAFTVEVLYGDVEGAQRMVSRFGVTPRQDEGWFAGVSRHWNVDGPDPR
jgi:hypothetical protein